MIRSPQARHLAVALTLIATLAIAGCTSGSASPTSGASTAPSSSASVEPSTAASDPGSVPPSAAASSAPSNDEPTESLLPFACTPTVTIPATTDRAQITDVRVGTHAGYDRIAFEFTGGIPDVTIEAVLPPFYRDASGEEMTVNGSAFLKVTMHGASRVSTDGVVTYAGPLEFEPAFPQLVHLIEGGDFEAVSTWYIGLDGGGCLRVLTLAAPSRLVIDIEH